MAGVLNISSVEKTQLLASEFPKRADIYVCDFCGTNVTAHFRSSQAHAWTPMGPERFQCRCGHKYLTGAIEWDHLGDWQRRNRLKQTVGLTLLLAVFGACGGGICWLFLRTHQWANGIFWTITVLPPLIMILPFVVKVAASIKRTRMGTTLEHINDRAAK